MELNHIPVIIGNSSTFSLITRAEDIWEVSTDDVNLLNYNNIKLCRSSGNIDIGIRPFSLIIGFDGSLILPSIYSVQNALEIFNRFLTGVSLGGIHFNAIYQTDVSYGYINNLGYFRICSPGSGGTSIFHMAAQLKFVSTFEAIKLHDPKKFSYTDIYKAYLQGSKITKNLDKITLQLMISGITYYYDGMIVEDLINIWTLTEQFVDYIWKSTIIDVCKGDKDRKNFLQDNRSWSVALKLEVLYQNGKIPHDTYSRLTTGRKARNNFIHSGTVPDKNDIADLIEAVYEILSL